MCACALLAAVSTRAQEHVTGEPYSKTAITFGTGCAVGAPQTGAALRLGVDRILMRRLTLELAGGYLDRGLGADAWTAALSLRYDLADEGQRAAPYFALGAGAYHATFERAYGQASYGACPGRPADAGCVYANMPRFYAQRMHSTAGVPAVWPERPAYTDPMVAVGAGVRWQVTPRLFVVPDVRALIVVGGGDSDTVGVFTLNVGYRF